MEIFFTYHAIQRKTEREDWMIRTPTRTQTRKSAPALEDLMRRKGRWSYRRDQETGLIMVYCIVNNLEVYCGVIEDDSSQEVIITTYYSYTSKMRKKLYPKGFDNYEPFDIEDPEFD